MTVFIIDAESEKQLRAAAERARTKPIPWDVLKRGVTPRQETHELTLADREGIPLIPREPEEVMLPGGWRVAITCEEQPAGFLLHISMSSPAKGKVPIPLAMDMLIKACGYSPRDVGRTWLEEYAPGKRAVNMLIMLTGKTTNERPRTARGLR